MLTHQLSIHIAEVAERPALRGALSRANERRHKNVMLAGHKIVPECRGTFGRVGQHYGVSRSTAANMKSNTTNLCKLPQPTVVGYDGPEIMAVAPVFRLKESGFSDGG
jgi:hypothetical protein